MTRAGTNQLGSLIKAKRKARKWTQEYLAERLGCSSEYVSMMERGKRPGSLRIAYAAAKAYNEPLAEIFRAMAHDNKVNPHLLRFLDSRPPDEVTPEEIDLLEGIYLPGRTLTLDAYFMALQMIRASKPDDDT